MDKRKRAHSWAFPLGLILTVLAIVGLATLVNLVAGGIRERVRNPKEIERYEEFLAKIIVHDPDPFDSVGAVPLGNIPQLLDISIWSILRGGELTPADLPTDDNGNMLISQDKVAAEFVKLFGIEPPKHASIEGSDFDFVYDPEEKLYRVPVTGTLNIYLPRVVPAGVKKTGNSIELRVEYLAYNDFHIERGIYVEPVQAAKVMLITLHAQDDEKTPSYRVGAIRQSLGEDAVENGTPKLG